MGCKSGHVPSIRGSATGVGLAADVGVLILISELEAEVVDNVASIVNDISSLSEVAGSGLAAKDLELGNVV